MRRLAQTLPSLPPRRLPPPADRWLLAASCAGGGGSAPSGARSCGHNYVRDVRYSSVSNGGAAATDKLQISEERLAEFLRAEAAFFAGQTSNSLSLGQVLQASTPQASARLSLAELPIRFAQRIRQIEELPGWQESEEMKEVHNIYMESFRVLRLVDAENFEVSAFRQRIEMLKRQMRVVIPRLSSGMRSLQRSQGFSEAEINQWLDGFLLSRVGTEMLTSQVMACGKASKGKGMGIVDLECDPAMICEQAAHHARRLAKNHFDKDADVRITVETAAGAQGRHIRFPYVPQYLFYIMVELLKNSARATVENGLTDKPVVITVGADPIQVAIRVTDQAGGIPFDVADRVWSYMYSTAGKSKGAGDFSQEGTPLAGYGVGLPLSRLYARYLGGSLHLMSLPGVGTSAYLYLKRIETDAREELPDINSSLTSIRDM